MSAPRFHPFARLIFCGMGLIGVQILLGALLVVGSALSTAWTNRAPDAQLLDLTTRFVLPLTVISYPASLAWMGLCRRRFDACSFVSLGLRPRRAGADMMRGIATGALAIALLWLLLWLTGAISVSGWSDVALQNGVGISILSLLGYALAFFAVGFFEETLFRGYVLHNLNAWIGWRGAVALQAILFALVHLGNVVNASAEHQRAALGALPSLFLIAVFFALCFRKTGSLWFPIGFHFAWDFFQGCVFSLPVSVVQTFQLLDVKSNENSWFSGGSFGAEGSFYLIPILLALIVFLSKAPDHPQARLDLALLGRRAEIIAPPTAVPTEELEDEMPEEERQSRFNTKFGTSQGFSADTLRELRDLQEAREKQQREIREARQREVREIEQHEARERSEIVAANYARMEEAEQSAETHQVAAKSDATSLDSTKNEAVTLSKVQSEPEIVIAPGRAVAPETVAPPAAEPAPVVNKKPPSPRW